MGGIAVLGKWWNGRWGNIARQDIRVEAVVSEWRVVAATGGADGREVVHRVDNETAARAFVKVLMARSTTPPEEWRDLVAIGYRTQRDTPSNDPARGEAAPAITADESGNT